MAYRLGRMLTRGDGSSYDTLRAGFRWRVPEAFNMGTACADRHPAGDLALVDCGDGQPRSYTFGDLADLSNRLANGLRALGVSAGDRVGIVLPQRVETGVAHLAAYKLGAIAIPMSVLFGPQALMYRLGDAQARVVITDAERADVVGEVAAALPGLEVLVVDGEGPGPYRRFWDVVRDGSPAFEPVPTTAETPGLIIYTSGTTGTPKGALHGHRVLLGHLPGFQLSQGFFPQPGDLLWTPADWAWIGGLLDGLMPSWYFGRPVVAARRQRFDPEWAMRLMREQGVRNAFLPPTALKLMRQGEVGGERPPLRSVMSGGESLGEEMLAWARERLGVTVNEIYGQTEANYVIGNCAEVWDVRPGSMGRAYPGHDIAIVGPGGQRLRAGEVGEIAVRADDPVMFLGYWNNEAATRAKYTADGAWLLTGDLGRQDDDGYVWFVSRNDDVINSAGYRIGPAEIEECLVQHPAVLMAAAVGVPDELRGEAVKAFVQLAAGQQPSEQLEREIQELVRTRLAAYEYPRQIEFVESLPLTTTGKIRRAELRQMHVARLASSGDS